MSRGLKNPYGVQDGIIVTADEVPNGLACGCVCPGCHERLIANHGKGLKQPYFSHKSGAECDAAYETVLHLMAKDILADLKRLRLPPLGLAVGTELIEGSKKKVGLLKQRLVDIPEAMTNHGISPDQIVPEGYLQEFDRVELEIYLDVIVPDVVMYVGDRRLLVEIYVTHATTDAKRRWLKDHEVPAIEFDFSATDRAITRDELKKAFLKQSKYTGQGSSRWTHHPLAVAKQAEQNDEFNQRILAPINRLLSATDPKAQANCRHIPVRQVGKDGIARLLCEKCWKFFSRIPESSGQGGSKPDDSMPLFN